MDYPCPSKTTKIRNSSCSMKYHRRKERVEEDAPMNLKGVKPSVELERGLGIALQAIQERRPSHTHRGRQNHMNKSLLSKRALVNLSL